MKEENTCYNRIACRQDVKFHHDLLLYRGDTVPTDHRVVYWDYFNNNYVSVGPDCPMGSHGRPAAWISRHWPGDVSEPHSFKRAVEIYNAAGGCYDEDREPEDD